MQSQQVKAAKTSAIPTGKSTKDITESASLPWSVGDHPGDNSGTQWRMILAPSSFGDAYVGQALKHDAELIVRAVNSHEVLVNALRAIEQGFMDGSIKWAKPRQADSDPYHPANTLMCEALALAESESA